MVPAHTPGPACSGASPVKNDSAPMIRFANLLCLTLLVGVFSLEAGCGSARRGAPVQAPFRPADAQVEQGQRVFMRYCNSCHPGGEAGVGLAINDKPLPAWLIRFQVRHGLGVMPSFSEDVISDEELRALSRYLVDLRRHDPEG